MPKLKSPLLSFGATGRLGKLLSLVRRRGQNIIERKPKPTDAKSPAQLFNRHMFTKCVDLWHLLSEAEKQVWESLARPLHMTGYAWFISQCLRPNPGIYLPLQGGTMQGTINMDGNRLGWLPEPIAHSEAATKLYVDAFSKIIWKDLSQTAMDDLRRTVSLPRTDLVLTPYTSPNAKIAIVLLRMKATTVGTGSYARFYIRKGGSVAVAYPYLTLDKAGTTVHTYQHQPALIGLNSSQMIWYGIYVGTGWDVDSRISVLGYVE